MRIALDATYTVDPQPSGIAVYCSELLAGMAKKYPQDEFLHCYRIRQFRKANRNAYPNAHRRLLLPPIPTFKADLFHGLNQRVDRRPAGKVISTFHDLFVITGEYSSPEFRQRFTRQAQLAAQNSDLIIAVSRFTANQVSSLLNFDPARIRVIAHGVRPPAMNNDTIQRENMILSVGALQRRKNIARLVAAFESVPDDWTLVLAGAPTGYGAQGILDRIDRSACRNRIRVTGYVSTAELERLYARASIFAFPSLDEGFGMPALDAMARGVAVLTSNRSALVEVAGNAAVLVDPENTEELATALNRLIHDLDFRMMLVALGRDRAKNFSWQRAVEQTYTAYEEALKK